MLTMLCLIYCPFVPIRSSLSLSLHVNAVANTPSEPFPEYFTMRTDEREGEKRMGQRHFNSERSI